MKDKYGYFVSGVGAGILNGLFGAGGGLVLVPLLSKLTNIHENALFPASVAILFPVCIISLLFSTGWEAFSLQKALPYLLGSLIGGICAGTWGKRIPGTWLHRGLGLLIIWGGIRYLW